MNGKRCRPEFVIAERDFRFAGEWHAFAARRKHVFADQAQRTTSDAEFTEEIGVTVRQLNFLSRGYGPGSLHSEFCWP